MAGPLSRVLSSSQLALLAEHGEELTAEAGERLYEIGDETYPFVAILEGEVAVIDGAGREIVRHGASGFLGEMNLLSGQTVFLTAVVTEPLRYLAVDREELRRLLFEDGTLSDLLLSAFVERRELLQQRQGIGPEVVRPARLGADPGAGRFRQADAHPPLDGRPRGEPRGRRAAGRGRPGRSPDRAAPGRRRAAPAQQRRALASARHRARAR